MPPPGEPMSSLIKLTPSSINLSDQLMSPSMIGRVHQSAIYTARATPLVQRPCSIPRGVGMPVWIWNALGASDKLFGRAGLKIYLGRVARQDLLGPIVLWGAIWRTWLRCY
jgi:hypothetical protein